MNQPNHITRTSQEPGPSNIEPESPASYDSESTEIIDQDLTQIISQVPIQTIDQEPNENESPIVDTREYYPERIIKHRGPTNNYEYLVKWKGYHAREATWESEASLSKCYDLVNKYKNSDGRRMGRPTFRKRYGASSSSPVDLINENNWVDFPEIMRAMKVYQDKRLPGDISVAIAEKASMICPRDSIYFIPILNHVFVALYIHSRQTAYIADGINLSLFDKFYQTKLSRIFLCNRTYLEYPAQQGVDHCGSSATLIALEFERLYVNKEPIPEVITISVSQRKKVVKSLHKEASQKIRPWTQVNDLIRHLVCDRCNYKTTLKNRRGYYSHRRICSRNIILRYQENNI